VGRRCPFTSEPFAIALILILSASPPFARTALAPCQAIILVKSPEAIGSKEDRFSLQMRGLPRGFAILKVGRQCRHNTPLTPVFSDF
jgi:hypothetical protein